VHVAGTDVVEVDVEDPPQPAAVDVRTGVVHVLDLEDGHVAAVAAHPLHEPLGRAAVTGHQGRDHLQERVAHREDGVVQPERVDPWIVERLAEAQLPGPRRHHLVAIGGRHHGLAQSCHSHRAT
jgi:hypothetical protein